MIENIINGIVGAIRTRYDKIFRIYTESVEQGLTEPCFSVLCLQNMSEAKAGTRHSRTYPCIIRYFPKNEDEPLQECQSVAENLYELLEVIDIGGKRIRGKDMKSEIENEVLQFQITYTGFVLATKSETTMEELEVRTDGN